MRARRSTNFDITTFESTQPDSTLTTFDGMDFGRAKVPAQIDADLTTFTSQYDHTESFKFGRRAQAEPLTTFESEGSVQYKPAFGQQTAAIGTLTTFESDSMSNPELSFGQRAKGIDSLTTFDTDSSMSRKSKSSFGKQRKVINSLTTFDSDTNGETALTTFDVAPNQLSSDTLTSWATDTNNLHL